MDILQKVKMLLSIQDNTRDDELLFYIDFLTQEAVFYTLSVETQGIGDTIVLYTIQLLNDDVINNSENVKSIKEGDTQVQFAGGNFTTKQMGIIDDFKNALKPFRVVKAVI